MEYMKTTISERGAGGKEIIIGLLVILGVFAVGVTSILNNTSGDDYKKMRIQADAFVSAVTIYKDKYTKDSGKYYLFELEKDKTESEYIIVDPKNKSVSCDMYESFVETTSPKTVRLRCGDYLVEGKYQEKYEVYEIGDWQQEKQTGETAFLFNYEKNGVKVLPEYLIEEEFIQTYNRNEGTDILDINTLYQDAKTKNITIESDMFYRDKKLVKEI